MSIYNEKNSIGGGDPSMKMSEYINNQVFETSDELVEWVQNLANRLGFVVVTKRSNQNSIGMTYRVVLQCDRGGKYRGKDSSRASGTKRIGCPFELEGTYLYEYQVWTINVLCDEHNHQPLLYMEGHAYVKRLSGNESGFVKELTKMNVQPRDILPALKSRNPSNVSTLKTIYNERQKIRSFEQVGDLKVEFAIRLLISEGYIYDYTATGKDNRLENLFFVHPKSMDLWRAFPHVLLIDATYNTNMYNLPLVEIVGVTSTRMTFCIAFVLVCNEKTANYLWLLNCLKKTLDNCMLPRVIITDRELALMNACREVFPDAAKLLCRWHIHQNLDKYCRQSFKTIQEWDHFNELWKLLINSTTPSSYAENYQNFNSWLMHYPNAYTYGNSNWLGKYREMFVSLWIDQHLHFENNTTNRVEGQHSKLKKYLGSSKSGLDKIIGVIGKMVKMQEIEIKESLEKSQIFRYHGHDLPCFTLLHGLVSKQALSLILKDRDKWEGTHEDCDCRLRTSCGLPCACQLAWYIDECQNIPLDSIDIFWRKLDISPLTTVETSVDDDPPMYDVEFEQMKETFYKKSSDEQKSLFQKIKNLFRTSTTVIREPEVKINNRGKPSKKQLRQKMRAAPVPAEPRRNSCSTMLNEPAIKMPARHSSYETDLNKRPVIDLNEVPAEFEISSCVLECVPGIYHQYISDIKNVDGDGNCGFRAIAVSLGMDEDTGHRYIREQMIAELDSNPDFYDEMFGANDVKNLKVSLKYVGSPCPRNFWMTMPAAGILIANKFNVTVIFLSKHSTTFFPFKKGPDDIPHHRTITIALIEKYCHYVMVELQGNHPMPPITRYWHPCRISPEAAGWEYLYAHRILDI